MLPRVYRRWKNNARLAKTIGQWIVLSMALGIYASIPAILRHLYPLDVWATSWSANIFLLYSAIEKIPLPSIAMGEVCTAAIFALLYAVILLAIYKANHQS